MDIVYESVVDGTTCSSNAIYTEKKINKLPTITEYMNKIIYQRLKYIIKKINVCCNEGKKSFDTYFFCQ